MPTFNGPRGQLFVQCNPGDVVGIEINEQAMNGGAPNTVVATHVIQNGVDHQVGAAQPFKGAAMVRDSGSPAARVRFIQANAAPPGRFNVDAVLLPARTPLQVLDANGNPVASYDFTQVHFILDMGLV